MFTVKFTYQTGHSVKSCASYEYCNQRNLDGNQSLTLYASDGSKSEEVSITGTVYVMNENGRTVDTFHARPTPPHIQMPPARFTPADETDYRP